MKRLCLFLLLSSLAFGQGVLVAPQQVLTVINGITSPVPNATITVCAAGRSGIPCSPALVGVLFKDAALTQPLPNPFTSDAFGNYVFAIAPGNYTVTTSGAGFAGYSYQMTAPMAAGANNTFSGSNTFTGPTTFGSSGSFSGSLSTTGNGSAGNVGIKQATVDNVQFVSTIGNDSNDGLSAGTAKASISAAFTALGAAGGRIQVASGTYTQALGTLNFTKSTRLICEGIKGTVLNFTGASGVAIIFNADTTSGGGGSFVDWAQGIENCQLIGPGGLAGTANAGIGIQAGDATHQAIGISISKVVVAGFTTGITWGNAGAWGTKVDHSSFIDNTQDLLYNTTTGGTENIDFYHDAFGQCGTCGATVTQKANGVQIAGTTPLDIAFEEPSFDNDQFSFTSTSALAKVTLVAPHFETGATVSSTTDQLHVAAGSGSGILSLYSPVFLWDPSSGSVPAELVDISAGNFILHGGYRASTNVTIANAVEASGGGVFLEGAQIASGFTNPNNLTSAGWYWSCPDASQGGCTSNLTGLGGTLTGFSLVSITAIGGTPTLSGTGSCATTSTQVGGKWAGSFVCSGTAGAGTITITPGITAPHGWTCAGSDTTQGTAAIQSGSAATTCTLKLTTAVNTDVINFSAIAY